MPFNYLFKSFEKNQEGQSKDIIGEIPSWLSGSFYRIGPAIFERGKQQVEHWFDGYGVAHKFTFQNSEMSYQSKILQTPNWQNDQQAGTILSGGWGTTNKFRLGSLFKQLSTANNNVSFLKFQDRLFSLSDYSNFLELDNQTLDVKSLLDFDDKFGNEFYMSAAHPAFSDGKVYNVLSIPGQMAKYVIYYLEQTNHKMERKVLAEIESPNLTYTHSLFATQNYIIFIEQPLVVDIFKLLTLRFNRKFNETMSFKPELGTKFHLINKSTGKVQTVQTEGFFFFHFLNAFESGNDLIIDLMKYKDNTVEHEFYFPAVDQEGLSYDQMSEFTRYKIDIQRSQISVEQSLLDRKLEFGQINRNVVGKRQRYSYFTGVDAANKPAFFNTMVKLDHETGQVKTWTQKNCFTSEGLFISKPDSQSEDDGLFINTVLDDTKGYNFVLILDGKSFQEIARVNLPYHFPAPLHASFYRN